MQQARIGHSFWVMFISPLGTLDSLRERPRWIYAVLLSAIISVAANSYIIERIGFVRLIESTFRAKAVIDPQGAMENALAHKGQILCFQAIATFVSPFFIALVTATVLWLLLTLFGHDLPFKKSLAVVAHANMLSIILRECMIVLTASIIRDAGAFNLRNPLATNIAFFLHPASPSLFRALASLDVITFMNMALLITGLTRVCARLSVKAASMIVVIPWAIYVGATLLIPPSLS